MYTSHHLYTRAAGVKVESWCVYDSFLKSKSLFKTILLLIIKQKSNMVTLVYIMYIKCHK